MQFRTFSDVLASEQLSIGYTADEMVNCAKYTVNLIQTAKGDL